jgi:hypothetical protein
MLTYSFYSAKSELTSNLIIYFKNLYKLFFYHFIQSMTIFAHAINKLTKFLPINLKS